MPVADALLKSTCVLLETFDVFPYWSSDVTVMFPEHCPAIIVNAFDVITSCVGDAAFTVSICVADTNRLSAAVIVGVPALVSL